MLSVGWRVRLVIRPGAVSGSVSIPGAREFTFLVKAIYRDDVSRFFCVVAIRPVGDGESVLFKAGFWTGSLLGTWTPSRLAFGLEQQGGRSLANDCGTSDRRPVVVGPSGLPGERNVSCETATCGLKGFWGGTRAEDGLPLERALNAGSILSTARSQKERISK